MEKETVTQTQIGNTLFIVAAECSPDATETIEKKLERLIYRRFTDTKSYQRNSGNQLAMCPNQSEYDTDTI
jgi:hypothetical protein